MNFWFQVLLVLWPMYLANSCAMLFGGKTPLDLNAKAWDGERFLGKGKTFKGTFFGVFFGTLGAILALNVFPQAIASVFENYALFGFAVALGAVVGDILGSFIKRRLKIASGKEALLLDQLGFFIVGILAGSFFFVPSMEQILVMAGATLLVHRFSNWIAFKTKLKEVPW